MIIGLEIDDDKVEEVRTLFSAMRDGTMSPLALRLPFISTYYSRGMDAREKLLAIMDDQLRKFEEAAAKGNGGASEGAEDSGSVMKLLMSATDDEGNGFTREQLLEQARRSF